jgi:iron complex transport system substrate-binding protein
MKPVLLLLMMTAFILAGCNKKKDTRASASPADTVSHAVHHANGFSLVPEGKNLLLTVRNPWQHAKGIELRYILSDTIHASVRIDEFTWALKTPVRNVICLSTTHIGFLDYIGKTSSISGISGKDYIVNSAIREGIAGNRIQDVGYDEGLDYELILRLHPDVVFAYGVNVSVTNTINKLNELGIPVVMIGEYLEQDPIAKMEWVKVFAACYGLQIEARYNSAADRYDALKSMAAQSEKKPTVLLGLPWRGNWYVSGAQSYVARLIHDAGGKYIWDHLDFNESRPMGLEMIYENALGAEFWINPGEARSKKEIVGVDERFGDLPAMANDRIFNNDNLMTGGGNAFYESGVVEPDIILSDLIAILHPHLLPSHKLKYYRKLQ